MRPEPPPPTLRLTIDTDALADNWRALDAMSGAADAGAAVKADCYGLGVDTCLPVLRVAGAKAFFVAHWSEVADVVRHVAPEQVAVLHGPMRNEDVAYACSIGALPVINSLEQARRWKAGGGGRCHLMVDTGINRLGVSLAELQDPAIAALEVDVLMSHLSAAEDVDETVSARQLARFRDAIPQVRHRAVSLANSAGLALGPEYAFNLTRPGLALYGGVPRPEMAPHLRQVAFVEAAILQVRKLQVGDAVGYNGAFVADRTMPVATVSLGYADGFLRSRGPGGALFHDNARLPLLGKVSMDMVVVDLSDAPDLAEGDWLQVPYSLPDAAQQSSLSQYELLTALGRRLRS
ncbi:MAG: alanine racemase [Erythrobacter sp.]